ncbi:splicing factor U2af small subunit B-like [Coffea eugenioides]|uniref:splicing factor U2af small subunit B-like n=1 Tax=Coffea eugenioides TaxID=49369 RepID=UPI000F60950F|nr:splicing factor U2af small subunit B-like [Coffea eugenioides]XP_027155114.1 splicing factor U2af small subunit B-like [Coffea eugenioides]
MYQRPDMITPGVDPQGQPIEPRKIQEHFKDFYEDIFEELGKFDEIESLNICDNLADHMISNVYIQFKEEDQAAAALQALQGHFYSGCTIIADFSPVTDFREATYRRSSRGGYCNFMHIKMIGRDLRRKLFGSHILKYRRSRSRSRSANPHPHHHHRRERERERDYDRSRDSERDYRASGRRSGGDRHARHESDSSGGRRRHAASPRRSKSPVREGSE